MEETKEFGNIFTGWDSYLSSEKVKLRKNVLLEDRQFSLSSVTSPASRREVNKKVQFIASTFAINFLFELTSFFALPYRKALKVSGPESTVKKRKSKNQDPESNDSAYDLE